MIFRTRRAAAAQPTGPDPLDQDIDELGPRLAAVARSLVREGRSLDLWGERRTHGYPPPHAIVDGVLDRAEVDGALDVPPGVEWAFRPGSGWSLLDTDLGTAIFGSTPGPGPSA